MLCPRVTEPMSDSLHTDLPPAPVVYGVDIAPGFCAVVRARRGRTGMTFETVLETEADVTGELLRDTLGPDSAPPRALLAMALPVRQSSLRWLTAPFPARSKARKVLPSLLDIQLPFPLESCVYGFPLMQEARPAGEVQALAVAARKEDVDQRLAEAAQWDLDPHSLDHEGLALWDRHVAEAGSTDGPQVIAFLAPDRTVWAVGVGGRLAAVHTTQTGLRDLTAADEAARERSEQSWRNRVRRMLRAVDDDPRHAGTAWYWAGPGAALPAVRERLEALLCAGEYDLQFHVHQQPGSLLARGLAARAGDPAATPTAWNFRGVYRVHPAVRDQRVQALRRTGWAALAAGLVLCAFNFAFGQAVQSQQGAVARQLQERARSLTGLPVVAAGQEVLLTRRAQAEQSEQLSPFLRAFQPSRSADLKQLLDAAQAGGWHYESMTLRPGDWRIQGAAGDWDQAAVLAGQLREQGWHVELERQEAIDVEVVRFQIQAERTP